MTVHFSKKTESVDYVGQTYKKVLSIHKKLLSGGVLVFVTGQREIEILCRKLCKASRKMVEKSSRQINDLPAVSEGNPVVDHGNNKINEAFEILGSPSHQQTDRFSSLDGDHGDLAEDEPDYSFDSNDDSDLDDSDEDSDLEIFTDDGYFFNQKNLDSDGKLTDVLREDGNLVSLKAALEALAGKGTLKPDSVGKAVLCATSEVSYWTNPSLWENMVKAEGPKVSAMHVLPLYARLLASAHLRVFDEEKEGERLVVVATCIAETSLTILGIKYVVDTGIERVKIYNSSNWMETYEVEWISN